MKVYRQTRWLRTGFICLTLIGILYGGLWWNQKQYSHPSLRKPLQFDHFEPIMDYHHSVYFLAQQRGISSIWRFQKQTGEFKQINTVHTTDPAKIKSQLIASLFKNITLNKENKELQIFTLSPNGSSLVKFDPTVQMIILYHLNKGRSIILPSISFHHEQFHSPDWMLWSKDERYLLLGNQIIQGNDGIVKGQVQGKWGSWSPVSNQLLFVNKEGDLCLQDVESGVVNTIFSTHESEEISSRPIWDPTGQYIAFATGQYKENQMKVKQVHVMDLQLFHYVENEQNFLPTLLSTIQLSPKGTFLLYTVDEMTKIIHLPSQELLVYDGYMQDKKNKFPYFWMDQQGVWLATAKELLYIDSSLQERTMSTFPEPLTGFYLSEDQRYQLAIESLTHGYRVSVVQLPVKDH